MQPYTTDGNQSRLLRIVRDLKSQQNQFCVLWVQCSMNRTTERKKKQRLCVKCHRCQSSLRPKGREMFRYMMCMHKRNGDIPWKVGSGMTTAITQSLSTDLV